jgi:hypothetical protein
MTSATPRPRGAQRRNRTSLLLVWMTLIVAVLCLHISSAGLWRAGNARIGQDQTATKQSPSRMGSLSHPSKSSTMCVKPSKLQMLVRSLCVNLYVPKLHVLLPKLFVLMPKVRRVQHPHAASLLSLLQAAVHQALQAAVHQALQTAVQTAKSMCCERQFIKLYCVAKSMCC